jgi:hypothetical protein
MQRSEEDVSTDEAGYFLVDALVGLFVLASVTGSLLAAFGLGRVMATRAEHMSKALVMAKSCVEESGFEQKQQTIEIDELRYLEIRTVETIERKSRHVVELVRIECAIQWSERGAPHEVQLERIEARSGS